MDAEEYIKSRLDDEIGWYDRKSGYSKLMHHGTRGVEIVCAAIIPFLAGFAKEPNTYNALAIGVLGILVAAAAGFSSLLKFQENWIKYRTTAESLKKEKMFFQTKVEPYDVENPFRLLVQRVEALVSQENTNWAQYMMKPAQADRSTG